MVATNHDLVQCCNKRFGFKLRIVASLLYKYQLSTYCLINFYSTKSSMAVILSVMQELCPIFGF